MFRVIKPLNNNGLLALTEEGREVILLGKGIGFGKKSGERIESLTHLHRPRSTISSRAMRTARCSASTASTRTQSSSRRACSTRRASRSPT